MITAVVCGIGAGVGLWALALGLRPPPPALRGVFARITTPAPPAAEPASAGMGGWRDRLGRRLTEPLGRLGYPSAGTRRDLAVLERTVPDHLAAQATAGLAGLLTPAAAAILLSLAGVPIGLGAPVIAGLVLAALGAALPHVQAQAEAARRRADHRHVLSALLDQVCLAVAAGEGIDSALHSCTTDPHPRLIRHIRATLDTARLTRTPPWAALRALGDRLDVRELRELAAAVDLAGHEGAAVRASLTARAEALRSRLLADTETAANAATERLAMPMAVLVLAFIVLIGYPAFAVILAW